MAAIYIWEISVQDIPINQVYGSYNKRKVKVYITGTATTSDTLNIATYIPGFSAVEGIDYCSYTGIAAGTASITWSGSTLTFNVTGTVQAGITGNFG